MRGSKSRINCFEKVPEIETGLGKNSLGKPKTLVVQLVKGFGRSVCCLIAQCLGRVSLVVADVLIGNRACDEKGRRMQPCDSKGPIRSRSDDRVWWMFDFLCFGVDTG